MNATYVNSIAERFIRFRSGFATSVPTKILQKFDFCIIFLAKFINRIQINSQYLGEYYRISQHFNYSPARCHWCSPTIPSVTSSLCHWFSVGRFAVY